MFTPEKVACLPVGATSPQPPECVPQPLSAVRRQLRHEGLHVRVAWQPNGHQQPGTVLSVQPAGQLPPGTTVLVTAALPHPDTTTGTTTATAMVSAADQEINPRPGTSAGPGNRPIPPHAPTVRELVAHACRSSGTRRARSRIPPRRYPP
jgi:hypothetical protein